MNTILARWSDLSPSRRWSLLAGIYAFGCAAVTAVLLSDMLGLFAEVIGLPPTISMLLLASPALVAGAAIWWAVVERSGTYAYHRGAAFGLLTALVTGAAWTGRFVAVWGVEMLTAGPSRCWSASRSGRPPSREPSSASR